MMANPEPFHMRRKEKEITDRAALDKVIANAKLCHIAMVDDGQPYVVPVTFGYGNNAIYFHSAAEGRKIRIIRKNSRVCFNLVGDAQPVNIGVRCTVKYCSVTGDGMAHIVEDETEKMNGFKLIVKQNLDHELDIGPERLNNTLVIKIDILDIRGKQSGF